MKTRENSCLDVNYKCEGQSDKQKKKSQCSGSFFSPPFLLFLFPIVLFIYLPDTIMKGVFWFLLGFIPFNLKLKQTPEPHAGYKNREACTLKSYHIPTYTHLGTFQGIL